MKIREMKSIEANELCTKINGDRTYRVHARTNFSDCVSELTFRSLTDIVVYIIVYTIQRRDTDSLFVLVSPPSEL